MSLEVFFPNDIRNALLAAEHASTTALQAGDADVHAEGYRAGYRAALVTLALAFGVATPEPQPVTWRVVESEVRIE